MSRRLWVRISDILIVMFTLFFVLVFLSVIADIFAGSSALGATVKIVVGLLFAFVGVGWVVQAFLQRRRAAASRDWPSTQGTVLSSLVKEYSSRNQEGQEIRSYVPKVSYDYSVAGSRFQGARLRVQETDFSKTKANEAVARYPVGAAVPVYYDPRDPREAFLETGISLRTFFWTAAKGVGWMLLGLLVLPALATL